MASRANRAWVQTELIPFLDTVFGTRTRREPWNDMIVRAERNLDDWKFRNTYRADFPASIEALRLLLINPKLIAYDERKPYAGLENHKTQDSVTIFVRHAINHGTYHLASHGNSPCREFPRGEDMGTLLSFYCSSDDVDGAEEEGHVPADSNSQEVRYKKQKAPAGASGRQRRYRPVANGQHFGQPVQPHLQQPYLHTQQAHKFAHHQSQQSSQYGQQVHQVHQSSQPQPQHYGQPNLQPLQPHLQPHNYVQQTHQPIQYYSQQTYSSVQWAPHPFGGWCSMPSHPVPQMGHPAFCGGPQSAFNQVNNWQAAPNAYHPGFNGNAPAFRPPQGGYQDPNA